MVDRLLRQDKAALDELYNRYSSALYGIIKRILKDEDVAEEVLQDSFIRIWDKIGSYNPEKGRLFTWMLNISRNLAIDKRRSKELVKTSKTDTIENSVSRVEATGQTETTTDTIGLIESLSQLPEEQRFVVEHLYLKGFTQSELAEEFNFPLGTIKTRLRLAMAQLRIIYQVK